tara:strand:- start:262 stop:471 length:210 start_codon:yes stop_codon:yes gene_type:complete
MKIVIVIFMLAIVWSLGSALYCLVGKKSGPDKMVKALGWRVGLSIALFILLFAAANLGYIQPHGLLGLR